MSALRTEHAGPVFRVTMTRPERRNAFDASLIAELTEAIREFLSNRDAFAWITLAHNLHRAMEEQSQYMREQSALITSLIQNIEEQNALITSIRVRTH